MDPAVRSAASRRLQCMQSTPVVWKPPPFIAVEGLDGSGKSTLAGALAAALDGISLTTPCPLVRSVRARVVEGLAGSPVARQAFYLATVAHASDRIRSLVAEGHTVVLARYLLSTMVYAEQRGAHLRWPELEASLLPADVTVFLDVPLAVREERMAARGVSPADLETLDPTFDEGLRRGYLAWSAHPVAGTFLHVVLRGDEGPDEVTERVLALLAARSAA